MSTKFERLKNRKHHLKKRGKDQENLGEPPKPGLILKTYNSLNHRLGFNQET